MDVKDSYINIYDFKPNMAQGHAANYTSVILST